ncbi:High-affnity carbon uptake protein Hat/HatR [Enhygromyxa salina]|uniref:High-affnity carbon uptake protein Hat/HatR n=1 Tax=Enhygromyxa salina TaxID=215803 RepID=A0A0C1ZIA6_9BACT|nr:protein kinase [Enhygromyxa salina]KIG17274.1 High-affnity carbon uptake protein Hat/HatR [Enhygromyxa salina]
MSEAVTKSGSPDGETTDELLHASGPSQTSFEHRRVVATARRRLFGRGPEVKIGRYRIERRLGFGGMGEVYLAHDEDLSRKLAIKRVLDAKQTEVGHARLRREAQALARLSHPNVVQIYDIGEHEQCIFLAMEYIDGETLGAWLDAEPRPWSAVVQQFVAAGRGLAAAHEAGLVHRDFKPDNVLLSADGRVRVADFGLALGDEQPWLSRGITDHEDLAEAPISARASNVSVGVRGTIRYMPLEQLRDEAVDARSDQFSFCVALYEALWGAPPFPFASSRDRLQALERGVPLPPPPTAGARPPARYWRVIRRGLNKEPDKRWPTMAALLSALDDRARRRRRAAWIGSVGAALVLAAGALVVGREGQLDPCAAVERELEGTWDAPRRAALERQLGAIDAGHAQASRERVFAGLDRWSQGWVGERERVCRANAEHRIEPEFARLQTACHTRQRRRVEDLVGLLLEPGVTEQALANAVEAVAALPSTAACEDELSLHGVEPGPPGIINEVESLRRELGRAHELRLLGSVEAGLQLAEATHVAAVELGYGPLQAETLTELAYAELAAGSLETALERILQAIDAAELHHHDYLAAQLWIEYTLRSLIALDDETAGSFGLRRAEVANDRINAPARARARLAFAHGQLARLRGDPKAAEQRYRLAVELSEVEDSADQPSYLANLANLVATRDIDEATKLMRRAVLQAETIFGPQHPQTARLLYDLGLALRGFDVTNPEVPKLLERAASIWRNSHSRPHHDLATAEWLLGVLAVDRGEFDLAQAHALALAEIQAASLPAGHRDHGQPAQLLATVYSTRGEYELALTQINAALAIWAPADGEDDVVVLRLRTDAAYTLLALGRIDEAEAQLDQLLARVKDRPDQAIPVYLGRCEVALRRGDLDAASAELLPLDPIAASLGPYAFSHALLRALIDLRRGQLDLAARERLQQAHASMVFTTEQIDEWIDQLDVSPMELTALGLE